MFISPLIAKFHFISGVRAETEFYEIGTTAVWNLQYASMERGRKNVKCC